MNGVIVAQDEEATSGKMTANTEFWTDFDKMSPLTKSQFPLDI